MGAIDSIGNFISDNSGAIGSALGTGAQLYGQQNAGEALTRAAGAAANTQTGYLDKASQFYQPYLSMGGSAASALGRTNGAGGAAPDYSGFMNMPGYKFAVQQGTQSAERQAAAMGNAGNSGTSAMIGNQVAGTAMQDYNTYINQLQTQAGIGASAAGQVGNMTYSTGANISQLQENAGQAQAGLYAGMGQTVGGAMGAGSYYGANSSGAGGGGGGAGGLVGLGLKAIGGYLGGNGGLQVGTTNPDGTQVTPDYLKPPDVTGPGVDTTPNPTPWNDVSLPTSSYDASTTYDASSGGSTGGWG